MKVFYLFLILSSVATTIAKSQTIKTSSPTFLALGDSYTIGESVTFNERWPNQLVDTLEKHYNIDFEDVPIIARTGWRTDNLINAIQTQSPDSTYDLVSLLIGVNNFYQGRPVSQYITEFEYLLKNAIALAGDKVENVFVVSIPDYAYTPFGNSSEAVSRKTDRYNSIADSITNIYDVVYYNITPISRKGLEQPDLVADDGLHPSGKQYSLWVEMIAKGIDYTKTTVGLQNETNKQPSKPDYEIENNLLKIINVEGVINGIIYDESGNIVRQFKNPAIDISNLTKGVYILNLKTENGVWKKKIHIK